VDRRYSSPDSMFDSRAYPKGAWVLHMLRSQLGEDDFWKCIKTYGSEHRYQSVETADFRKTPSASRAAAWSASSTTGPNGPATRTST